MKPGFHRRILKLGTSSNAGYLFYGDGVLFATLLSVDTGVGSEPVLDSLTW